MAEASRYARLDRRLQRYPPPLSAPRALALIERLAVPATGRILELGCGTGGLLLDAVAHYGCAGCGIEADAELVACARENVAAAGLAGRIEILGSDEFGPEPRTRYAAMVCCAATDAFGTLEEIAERACAWLNPGGLLVLGAPFLRRAASGKYVDLLVERLGALARGPGSTGAPTVVRAGFELHFTMVLGEAEWDAYESASYRALLRYAALHPTDPDAAVIRARAEATYHGYWQHGRDSLGFALHCFGRARRTLAVVA
jgi:SAM-dependent methyltransferase